MVAVYFSPRRVYSSESVRQADLGARKLRMSSQHSSGGRTSEAYLVIAPCYISCTQLGWAKRTASAENVSWDSNTLTAPKTIQTSHH